MPLRGSPWKCLGEFGDKNRPSTDAVWLAPFPVDGPQKGGSAGQQQHWSRPSETELSASALLLRTPFRPGSFPPRARNTRKAEGRDEENPPFLPHGDRDERSGELPRRPRAGTPIIPEVPVVLSNRQGQRMALARPIPTRVRLSPFRQTATTTHSDTTRTTGLQRPALCAPPLRRRALRVQGDLTAADLVARHVSPPTRVAGAAARYVPRRLASFALYVPETDVR